MPHDAAAAKKLLAEAGYPDGFEVGMNCPCQRLCHLSGDYGDAGAIGVKVNLMAETKVT